MTSEVDQIHQSIGPRKTWGQHHASYKRASFRSIRDLLSGSSDALEV